MLGLFWRGGANPPAVGTLVGDAEQPERIGIDLAMRLRCQV